jgi:ADP-heptose:LPS heptosyltransferase
VERFGDVAVLLSARGIRPVVVGGEGDAASAAVIRTLCPAALDLTGKTDLQALAGLAARAELAFGGDTGPIHLAGMMGCRTIALFSRYSDPANATPEGPSTVLRADRLADLSVAAVAEALVPG